MCAGRPAYRAAKDEADEKVDAEGNSKPVGQRAVGQRAVHSVRQKQLDKKQAPLTRGNAPPVKGGNDNARNAALNALVEGGEGVGGG